MEMGVWRGCRGGRRGVGVDGMEMGIGAECRGDGGTDGWTGSGASPDKVDGVWEGSLRGHLAKSDPNNLKVAQSRLLCVRRRCVRAEAEASRSACRCRPVFRCSVGGHRVSVATLASDGAAALASCHGKRRARDTALRPFSAAPTASPPAHSCRHQLHHCSIFHLFFSKM